jgi:hypothetical protein
MDYEVIVNDIVGDLWRRRIIGEMSRDELRTRITGGAPLETKEQAHKKAEEIVKRHINERNGVEEQKQGYPRSLKQHPQQRIYIGDQIL